MADFLALEELTAASLNAHFNPLENAWSTWSPTLTNLTLGNGTVTARHRTVGKTMDWRFRFLLGSTSAVGTLPGFTLPSTPHSSYIEFDVVGRGALLDAGTAGHPAVGRRATGSAQVDIYRETDTAHVTITATVPWTWTTGDAMFLTGTTELA